MYALLCWHALFSRHSVVTFFSTLGGQFFLDMQRRGNKLGTFGHHRRPSGRGGKGREHSVNPWELSGTVGNLHFERFFTRFRHQIGQIWSYRGIHSTNRCEISRSFIWKGSWGMVFCKIYDFCKNFQCLSLSRGFLHVFVTKSVGNRFHELSYSRKWPPGSRVFENRGFGQKL